jgi:hypothetical protein
MNIHRRILVVATIIMAGACTSGSTCSADDDCALDAQCRAGQCVPLGEGEGEGEGEGDSGSEGEGEGEGDGAEGEGEGPQRCSLVDGALSVDDLPIALGLPIRMLAAASDVLEDLPVDVDGALQNGVRTWDFRSAVNGEEPTIIEALALGEQWFADRDALTDLPPFDQDRGTYVAPLGGGTLGVLEKTDDAVLLHAVASEAANRTFIHYDPPITALSFPLALGSTFSSESTGSGTFELNPFYISTDGYTSEVDGEGIMRTLAGDVPVYRLRIEQVVTVGLLSIRYLRYQWLTPCLGTVVEVRSSQGETSQSFVEASLVRRLAAP